MFSSVLYFLLRFRQRTQVKFVGCFKPAWQTSKAKRWGVGGRRQRRGINQP